MSTEKIRIRIKAYDHRVLDNAAKKIVETVRRSGGVISGPVPLPTEIEKFTILRAVHKYKDSREQFEMRTHKRLIDIKNPSKETIDALAHYSTEKSKIHSPIFPLPFCLPPYYNPCGD